jgi:catechol 2,3-dioxygenase-like lactoylglutathione lyase family enzyme/N-acetylglutamate synthase-like GNAT family acetyltransferase
MQIDHIAIWTNDLELEKDFYLKYFNCTAGKLYENPQKKFSSYFLNFADGGRIELMKKEGILNKQELNVTGFAHISIGVGTKGKIDELTIKLKNDGYKVESNPRTTGDGYYESAILDPEENLIELTAIEDYKVIPAEEKDLKQILYLQKCCYLAEAEIYNEYNIPPITQTYDGIQNDFKNQTILKLEYKGQIIGSMRAYLESGTCYIGRIIVEPGFQNMGFGKLLLTSIESKFNKANRFELFTGNRSERNLYLYKKCGYNEFKKETHDNLIFTFLEKRINR